MNKDELEKTEAQKRAGKRGAEEDPGPGSPLERQAGFVTTSGTSRWSGCTRRWMWPARTTSGTWVSRASTPSPGASSPPCTAAGSGPCGSTPASAPPRRPTAATSTCSQQGQTGLSVAFDLPTQMGYDSDHPAGRRGGRQGRRGDRLPGGHGGAVPGHPAGAGQHLHDDQRHGGHPARACTSPWPRSRGSPGTQLDRHDPERHPEGVHRPGDLHLPAGPLDAAHHRHLRLLRGRDAPLEHHQHQRLPHPRGGLDGGPGGRLHPRRTASPTWRRRSAPGCDVDGFAPRLAFFFNAHNNLLEEVAKFRAARRLWARIMRERFGAKDPRSWMLRFHAQTAGSTLTAQQPENNVVRVTLQALAAVLGGAQSLHTNSRDEALGLPTEEAVRIALRTQQILAHESGVADVVDPLGGAYAVEALTDAHRGGGPGLPRPDRPDGRDAPGHRAGLRPEGDPGGRLPGPAGAGGEAADRGRRQRVRRRRGPPASRSSSWTSGCGREQCQRLRAVRAGATAGRVQAALRRAGRGRGRHREPPALPSWRRSGPTPRSGRSATRCAASSACTRKRWCCRKLSAVSDQPSATRRIRTAWIRESNARVARSRS